MDDYGFLKQEEINVDNVDVDDYFKEESNEKEIVCPHCGYKGKIDEFNGDSK